VLYSRLPAQFVSLFFEAQANRVETIGLAIIPTRNLIKVLLFMVRPNLYRHWPPEIPRLRRRKRGDCTPIAYSFGATKNGKASGRKDGSETNRQRLFQNRPCSVHAISFENFNLRIKRRRNLERGSTFFLEVRVEKAAQAVRRYSKLAASVDTNNS